MRRPLAPATCSADFVLRNAKQYAVINVKRVFRKFNLDKLPVSRRPDAVNKEDQQSLLYRTTQSRARWLGKVNSHAQVANDTHVV